MKRISRNIFFFIIVLAVLFLGLAPRLFILTEVQQKVTRQVGRLLDSSVTIKKMHWVWLPLPHLTLVDTEVSGEQFDLTIPRVKIYPSWRMLLGKTDRPGRIHLDSPRIHLNSPSFLPAAGRDVLLPEVTLTVTNGELSVAPSEEHQDILTQDSLIFSDIQGKLKLRPREVGLEVRAASAFSRDITLQGTFRPADNSYRISLDARDIKLHKSVQGFFKGRLIPVESTADLTGTVIGKGVQQIDADLRGTLPCFTVKPGDREILLNCGFTDLQFTRSGPLMRLDINDLEIKDPEVNLSGRIERKLSSISGKDEPASGIGPVWTIDLTGSDLDITAIRSKVLTLWRDNKIAATVGSVVLGGRALSAAYRFSGRAADFKRLDAMIIEADVLDADLHVPRLDLDLTGASGPIRIKGSTLTGRGLSARMGKSVGRNADLLLALKGENKAFRLDIDIDADLAVMPAILARVVKHDGFQQQLAKFGDLAGTATGTLHLGDRLRQITLRAEVEDMRLAARYAPIPEVVVINSGALQLGPGEVNWQDVNGRIGSQEVIAAGGKVSWQTGAPLLNIDHLQARLQGAPLRALLLQTGVMPRGINEILSSLNGTIEVRRGLVQGPARQPGAWKYDLALAATDLVLASSLLPEPVRTENFAALATQDEIIIQEAAVSFLQQRFSLKGSLRHHRLENWHGMIEFNGPVQEELADWISGKGWFPEKLHPRIPCIMENLQVRWQGKTVAVAGTILRGSAGGSMPMVRIDYENSPEHLRINDLVFLAPGEQGRLQLDFWRISPHNLMLSWEGFVNADTIAGLFRHSSFIAGTVSGDFKVDYLADRPEATRFEGFLQAENLLFRADSDQDPMFITNLDLFGAGSRLRIPSLGLAVGSDTVTGSGQLAAEKGGLQLDISLASAHLANESLAILSRTAKAPQELFFADRSRQGEGIELTGGWDITGRIGFTVDSFALSRNTNMPYEGERSVTYTFHDVQGDLQLAADKISRTEIFSASLCGLDFSGTWFSDTTMGQKFQLGTDPDHTLRLEKVLPCLGVQQDIIEGEFSLQANLLRESDIWYGGNVYIKSSQGRILRLQTLSRIFKVVNITDLFTQHVENTGKRGFPFSQMDVDMHINDNNLVVDRAIILGEGLNLFARGEVHLDDYDADLTLLIAPFKTFDTVISKIPFIGQPIAGEYGSRVSIPVAVKGPIADPTITPLHPEAIGGTVLDLIKDTFMLPYNILNPPEPADTNDNPR